MLSGGKNPGRTGGGITVGIGPGTSGAVGTACVMGTGGASKSMTVGVGAGC